MKNYEYDFYKSVANGSLPDTGAVRAEILEGKKKRSGRSRMIITIAACLTAVVAVSFTVEPVRATILSWFRENRSVENYVAQPAEERTYTEELEQIIMQTKPETDKEATMEFFDVDPEWQDWVDELQPTVGNAFYDGYELIIPLNFKSGAMELVMAGGMTKNDNSHMFPTGIEFLNVGFVTLDGKTYSSMVDTKPTESMHTEITQKYTSNDDNFDENDNLTEEARRKIESENSIDMTSSLLSLGEEMQVPDGFYDTDIYSMTEDELMSFIRDNESFLASAYNPDGLGIASGEHEMIIDYRLVMTDYASATVTSEDEYGFTTSYDKKTVGFMRITLPFNAVSPEKTTTEVGQSTAFVGEALMGTGYTDDEYAYYENKTVDLSQVSMTVENVETTPTELKLIISYDFAPGFDAQSFLYQCVLEFSSDEFAFRGSSSRAVPGKENTHEYMFNILASESENIKTVTITPTLGYYAGFDNAELVEDGVTKIPLEEDTGYQQGSETLTDSAFAFEMPR